MTTFSDTPIIIIGAGRSGTKLLRGVLGTAENTACFPREINYIWRHHNAGYSNDDLSPEHARPEVIRYIRDRFEVFSTRHGGCRVLEKTVANCLRVPFVYRIFPDAFFIHIIRDGRAVAESARARWLSRPELGYLLEKARWVPMGDMLYYALRYLSFQAGRLRSDNGEQSSWGPRFQGLSDLRRNHSLLEVCAIQWRTCVQAAISGLECVPNEQKAVIHFEDLVFKPAAEIETLFSKAGLTATTDTESFPESQIRTDTVSRWRSSLTPMEQETLTRHLDAALKQLGYSD